MDSIVQLANRCADAWWPYVAGTTWQASVVAGLIILAIGMSRRMPARLQSGLILVAFLKFVIPPMAPGPLGYLDARLTARAPTVARSEAPEPLVPVEHSFAPAVPPRDLAVSELPDRHAGEFEQQVAPLAPSRARPAATVTYREPERLPAISWAAIGMLVSLSGSIFLLWLLIQTAVQVRATSRQAENVTNGALYERFRSLASGLGIRRNIRLLVMEKVVSPMAFGIVRPAVIVPVHLRETLKTDELDGVLAHELAHHRRRDPLWNMLQSLVLCVWWFNPLIWILRRMSQSVREDCCDDLVLQRQVTSRDAYSRLIVRLAEVANASRSWSGVLPPVVEMHPSRRRLVRILESEIMSANRLSWRGAAFVILAGVLCLPGSGTLPAQQEVGETRPDSRNADSERNDSGEPTANEPSSRGALPPGALARLGSLNYRLADSWARSVFLSDNRTVVSMHSHGLRFWDARTGEVVRDLSLEEHEVQNLAASRDHELLAVAGFQYLEEELRYERFVHVIGAEGTIHATMRWEEEGEVACLVFTPDSQQVITGSSRGHLRVWDIASESELLDQHFSGTDIHEIDISPDGETLVIAGLNWGAFWWDWLSGAPPVPMPGLGRSRNCRYTPDGSRVITGGDSRGVIVWDAHTKQRITQLPDVRSRSPLFSADGELIADLGKGIEFWDLSTGQRTRTISTGRDRSSRLAISPDGRWLVSNSTQPVGRVWDLESGEEVTQINGHSGIVTQLQFSPEGSQLITASDDGTTRLWESGSGIPLRTLNHERWVRGMTVSPDGSLIATSSLDDTVKVWERETGRLVYSLYGHGWLGGQRAVEFTPDNQRLLSWGDDMFLRIWDMRTGKALAEHAIRPSGYEIEENEEGGVATGPFGFVDADGGLFSPDGSRFLLNMGQKLFEFDVESGTELRQFDLGASQNSAMSHDGRLLATSVVGPHKETVLANGSTRHESGKVETVRIVEFETGEVIREISVPATFVSNMSFSPDDSLLAVSGGTLNDALGIFDVASGKPRFRVTWPDQARSWRSAISPDNSKLVTAHQDGTCLLWDLQRFRVPASGD